MPFAPGSRLAQYEIVTAVGSGGMGVVYHARDTRLGRDVAIKVMAPHIAADPAMRARFETEARSVAALSHPGILSIYELAIADGVPFAVMELLEGRNLRQRIAAEPIPWREAAGIAADIADGLAAAHLKGIVHRDLKPENVFLTSDGHVKILDFGLALQAPDGPAADGPTIARTAQGVVLGTFGYMSPEQVTGDPVDARTDVFALGCLLHEMLTSRQLFTGATPQEIMARLLRGTAPAASSYDPVIPPALRSIVARAVERNPARRFESASEMAGALRALLSGSAVVFPKAPRPRGKSLAVLPFVNAADPQFEYLADGIAESVINTLSQLSTVRVVPRSVVFRYKGVQVDPFAAGMALNARTILTGKITQYEDVLVVQAELVDTATESQLWGEQFRHRMSELMTVQEEIAWHISEALRLKLTPAQRRTLRKRATVNPEAYQAYLRGRHHWNSWTPEGFRRAVDHFQQAIDLDAAYALAYAGLGDAFGAMAYYGHIDPEEGFSRARAAAERALALDPALADAHVTLGLGHLFARWDWKAAEDALDRAIALNPKLATARSVKALYLATCGRFDEALAEAKTGRELDPLSPFTAMGVAWVHHFSGNREEAVREALQARELAPALEEAGNVLIAAYEGGSRYEEALQLIASQRCWGVTLDARALLDAYRRGGPEGYWRTRVDLLTAAAGPVPAAVHYTFAIGHVVLGEIDAALDYLDRMVEAHAGGAVFIGIDPTLRQLRGNERFESILTRVGSPIAAAPDPAST